MKVAIDEDELPKDLTEEEVETAISELISEGELSTKQAGEVRKILKGRIRKANKRRMK